MKTLTLTLKIAFMISASASPYPFIAVPQPAVAYILQINFNALTAVVVAVGNLKSAVAALGPNQCVFYQLEGHQKLWNEESSCSLLIMFIQTEKMHLNVNKWIMWGTTDKPGSEMVFNTCRRKCQTKTVKKVLKSLSKPQWYIIDVKSFNVHTFLLEIHPSDISDSEEKIKEKLMSVNAVY